MDALLPLLYYVYTERELRQLLNAYGILGYDFSNIRQDDFCHWLTTLTPEGHLPPPLLVLHTMIMAFGMPPAPTSDIKPSLRNRQ